MNLNTGLFNRRDLAETPMTAEPTLKLHASAATSRVIHVEDADAAAARTTTYKMTVGDTFNGSLDSAGDQDWVQITLRPGTYAITLEGRGTGGVSDTYLGVLNANGVLVSSNDDSGYGRDSKVILQVSETSTYYISAGSYAGGFAGDYSLEVNQRSSGDFWAMSEVAGQLTDGFWEYDGGARRAFDVGSDGRITVDLSQLTAAGQRLADMALAAWEAVTGIAFVRGSGAGAEITFDDNDSAAYSSSRVVGETIISSHVNVGLDWLGAYGTGFDTYSYQTYIHEIGHALGLGHAGNYDGEATYGVNNLYPNDSWQATVMSYFSQVDNTRIQASEAYVMSAMKADILAMQDLYGVASIRTGDNTYGEQTNAGRAYSTIAAMLRDTARYGDITFTVFDEGGKDRLDLHSDSSDQRINLAPGGISSAYGLIGNISIAEGTIIEEVLTGSGNDYVLGNTADNRVWSGAGSDTIYGLYGNDTLIGNQGADSLLGGAGNDSYFIDTDDVVIEAASAGRDMIYSPFSYQLGANIEDLSLRVGTGTHGTGNALDNRILGNDGANMLQGLDGNDVLSGQAGNDTLYGGNGRDWLMGEAGRDVMNGGGGNDTYVTDGLDLIIESTPQTLGGIDTVRSTVSIGLAINIENLVLLGSSALNGYGNASPNFMTGNSGANYLTGNDGNDRLTGLGGADTFLFNAGRDTVADFTDDVDTIRFDDVVWGGGARTIAEVLDYAEVKGGNTVFDFGNGNTLTVTGLTNIAALQNDIWIV